MGPRWRIGFYETNDERMICSFVRINWANEKEKKIVSTVKLEFL